ncbi:hypothetical protein BKA56DRAFT_594432 [Ilyonectria sp. MPI-CAGE-AT-0026]|nr:hypothetical protein BKA56DRAFT_594432 [Ilyonectria sp. MPI-CAGE-AT-0026]
MMISQSLPFTYGTFEILEAALTHVLGNSDFEIDAFVANQWDFKAPRKLTDEEVEYVRSEMRKHGNKRG